MMEAKEKERSRWRLPSLASSTPEGRARVEDGEEGRGEREEREEDKEERPGMKQKRMMTKIREREREKGMRKVAK